MRVGVSELTRPSNLIMRVLVLVTAYFLLVLFLIGVFDLILAYLVVWQIRPDMPGSD